MIFHDRKHAGQLLAEKVKEYLDGQPNQHEKIVIGLPRGGVVTAYEIAKLLKIPLDIIAVRKIGAPYNEEYALGAITEENDLYLDRNAVNALRVSSDYLTSETENQFLEAKRRAKLYRQGREKISFKEKYVILVDDGIATGATIKAAIEMIKKENPYQLIIAVPVSSRDSKRELESQVDQLICLSAPYDFQAVGQFYEYFTQTSDEEVLQLLRGLKK